MPAPAKPLEQQKALAAFEGKWTGALTLSGAPWDPTTGKADTVIEAKLALGGLFLLMDLTQKAPDQTTLQAHLVLGYNAGSSEHRLFWFDSQGSIGQPFVGKLEGNVLRVVRDGAKAQIKLEWTVTAKSLGLKFSTSTDGTTWTAYSEGQLARG